MTIKDAIYALKYMKKTSVNSCHTDALDMAIKALEGQPEIIHCKDCKYYTKAYGWNGTEYTVCCEEGHKRPLVNADDFCSRAERKE